MLQIRKYCKWCLFCVIFWPLRLWNGGDVNFLINIMFVGILFWGRKVGLHVKRQKEWYISVVLNRFLKTLYFQMKWLSVPSQRWVHWPTIIYQDFIINERLHEVELSIFGQHLTEESHATCWRLSTKYQDLWR